LSSFGSLLLVVRPNSAKNRSTEDKGEREVQAQMSEDEASAASLRFVSQLETAASEWQQ